MKKRWISVFVTLCLLLGACGADKPVNEGPREDQTTESQKAEVPKDWAAYEIEMPDADIALEGSLPEGSETFVDMWGLAEETVYRLVSVSSRSADGEMENGGWCVQLLQAPYTEWQNYFIAPEDWVEGESCTAWKYGWANYLTEDGALYMLLKGAEGEYVGKWSPEEGCSATKLESDWLTESNFDDKYPLTWSKGEGIGYYFLCDTGVVGSSVELRASWLDEEYKPKSGMLDVSDGYVWQITENPFSGKTYLCGCGPDAVGFEGNSYAIYNKGFSIWTADDKNPVFTAEEVGMWDSCVDFFSETDGYLWNQDGIWHFSLADQSIERVYSSALNIEDWLIRCGFCVSKSGSLLMLSKNNDQEFVLWELKDAGSGQEKKELELAVTIANTFLEKAVADFNKQSDEYRIVLRTPEDGEYFDDYRTRIQAELAAGGGPALLEAGSAINLEDGAQKGYLLELSEYFAEYEDTILPSVWQTGQVEGGTYAVPYSCGITTLVTSTDVVGDRKGWTLQEAMECMEASDAVSFTSMQDEVSLFWNLGLRTGSNTSLIDWEQGISHLDSDEAVKLLEFSVKYADHESTFENAGIRVAEGEVLTDTLYLLSGFSIWSAVAMFEGKEAYIGFPAEDGEGGSMIFGNSFAVNRACPYKEGALAFLKYLLSEEVQAEIAKDAVNGTSGFPVQKDALEQFFAYLKEGDAETGSVNGFEYEGQTLTDEQIERAREVFLTARPTSYKAEYIASFIGEELGSYLSGDKTAKEVMDIIHNRTQLYLYEIQ